MRDIALPSVPSRDSYGTLNLVPAGAVAQLVERVVRNDEVWGSIPHSSTRFPKIMPDPTRDAAYSLLQAVFTKSTALDSALDKLPKIEPRDRAAAHRLAACVLRHAGTLDAVLEPFIRRAPPDEVRQILRIGAAGYLFLETPPHAAVGTAVDLARSKKLTPFAGLVNAVLRKLVAQGPAILEDLDMPRLDTPPWALAPITSCGSVR